MTLVRPLFLVLVLALALSVPARAAVRLDGTGGVHLRCASGAEADFTRQTVMAWYYLESSKGPSQQAIVHINDQRSPADSYLIVTDTDGVTAFAVVRKDGAPTDFGPVQVMTIGKWYFLAMVRNGDTFLFYVGDETTPPSLAQTLTETGISGPGAPGWACVPFGGVVHGRVERWKHYTAALNLTRITEEWASLDPHSTINLRSYNPLITHSDYTASAGSGQYTIEERGTGTFDTASGPDVLPPPARRLAP